MSQESVAEIPLDWRIACSLLITRWWLHSPDPAFEFQQWLDEAGVGDEAYIRYAMRAFDYTSHLNYVELEEREQTLVRWDLKRRTQGSA